jgi:hypothetical protein
VSLAAAAAIGSILSPVAQAANYYWDQDGNSLNNYPVLGTGLGGTGTWDAASSLWANYNSVTGISTDGLWPNSVNDTDTATFTGTAGTITITSGGINAGSVQFFSADSSPPAAARSRWATPATMRSSTARRPRLSPQPSPDPMAWAFTAAAL